MAAAAGRVKLREAIDPLVLAVDIGSTASRGDVYDAAGRPVRGGREKVPHQFTTRDDGTSEIDPDQIVGEVQQIIIALATDRRAGRIGGVALDTFVSPKSTLPYAADGRPWLEQLGSPWSPTASPAKWAPALLMRRPSPPPWLPVALCGFSCTPFPRRYRPGSGAIASTARARCWVGLLMTWAVLSAGWSPLPEDDFNLILAAAPQADSPLVLPYFSGERSTGWAANARAVFAGVSAATTGAMLFRGAMEGIAISYARVADQLRSVAGQPQRILASGRVTQDLPTWLQILADVLEAAVIPVTIKRSTLRGTALIALEVLAPDVARTASATGEIRQPVADRAALYRARKQDYQTLYEAAIAPAGTDSPPESGIGGRASSPRRTATSGK